MKRTIYLLICVFSTISITAQTNVPATISTNQTWTAAGNPYIIKDSTIIEANASVTIMPGVVVQTSDLTSDRHNIKGIIIKGQLRALGKKDSIIVFNKAHLYFADKSKRYDIKTGDGCFFDYCQINDYITVQDAGIRIQNSKLLPSGQSWTYKGHITSEISGSSIDLYRCDIETSINTKGRGYWLPQNEIPANTIRVDQCTIKNTVWVLTGVIQFTNNTVLDSDSSHFYVNNRAEISCNLFRGYGAGIHLHVDDTDTGSFEFNTLDSMGVNFNNTASSRGALNIHASSSLKNFKIQNNNFLSTLTNQWGIGKKVRLKKDSAGKKNFTLDLRKNYWGYTSFSKIDSFVYDYNDDVVLRARVNYSDFLKSPDTSCQNADLFCQAYFFFGVDTSNPLKHYVIEDNKKVSKRVTYQWDFGDGTRYHDPHPIHSYAKKGTYEICLTIQDEESFCQSQYCDKIYIDNDNVTVEVLGDDELSIRETPNTRELLVYPNPNAGTFVVQPGNRHTGPWNITLTNGLGQVVYELSGYGSSDQNKISIDVKSAPNGIYFLKFSSSQATKFSRVEISH